MLEHKLNYLNRLESKKFHSKSKPLKFQTISEQFIAIKRISLRCYFADFSDMRREFVRMCHGQQALFMTSQA